MTLLIILSAPPREGLFCALPGVTAEVDLDGGRAVVRAEQLPDDAALTSAVTEAGYKVVGIE